MVAEAKASEPDLTSTVPTEVTVVFNDVAALDWSEIAPLSAVELRVAPLS
jgi:hypothetical protein